MTRDRLSTDIRARTRAIPQTPYAMNEAVLTDRKMWLILILSK